MKELIISTMLLILLQHFFLKGYHVNALRLNVPFLLPSGNWWCLFSMKYISGGKMVFQGVRGDFPGVREYFYGVIEVFPSVVRSSQHHSSSLKNGKCL